MSKNMIPLSESELLGSPLSEAEIDAAIDSILKASGSALKNYSMQSTINNMREAMKKIMS